MNNDYFKQMLEMQKTFFDQWQKAIIPDENSEHPMAMAMKPFFELNQKFFNNPQVGMDEAFHSMYKPFFEMNQKFFQTMKNGEAFDIYNKMVGGGEAYLGLFKLWHSLVENTLKPLRVSTQELYEKWEKEMGNQFDSYFMPYIPENFRSYVKNPVGVFKLYREITTSLLEPWLNDFEVDFSKYIKRGPGENAIGYIDFVSLWKEDYAQTIGKILNSPALGSNREYIEKQTEFVDTFVQYLTNIGEFSASLYTTSVDTVKKVMNDFTEMAFTDGEPKSFREFYDHWSKEIDKAYDKLFTTGEFSKLMGQYVNATMDFKMKLDGILEDYFKMLPMPTRSEMNSLYKTVDQLKREIRQLKRQAGSDVSAKNEDSADDASTASAKRGRPKKSSDNA